MNKNFGRPVKMELVDIIDNTTNEVRKVTSVYINGEHVAVANDPPLRVHGANGDDAVKVTLTLFTRELHIGVPPKVKE